MSTENVTNGITILGMEQRVFESWVAIVIIIVGFIFLIIAAFNKKQKSIVFGLGFFILGLLYMFIRDIEFRNLMLALSSIIALILSYLSFLQSERIRKDTLDKEDRDRKERLLNEIIEWAEDIRKSSSENVDPKYIILDSPVMAIASQQGFLQLQKRYQDLNKKSAYMKEVISKVFGCELVSAVEKVIQQLDNNIEMLRGCLTRKDENSSEKVEACKKSLDCCAEELIIEATNIKTKNIVEPHKFT